MKKYYLAGLAALLSVAACEVIGEESGSGAFSFTMVETETVHIIP